MANLSQPSKHAIHPVALEGEVAVEKEHAESCDINKMLRDASRGRMVRGGGSQEYGYDDLSLDYTALRIQKAGLEEAILNGQKEFSEEELNLFPKHIQEKFGFKLKAKTEPINDAKNDDQTTKKATRKAKEKAVNHPEDPEETPDS